MDSDVLSIDQMRTILRQDRGRMADALDRLKRAERAHAAQLRDLDPRITQETRSRIEREIEDTLLGAEREAVRIADAADKNARRVLEQTATTALALDPDDEARAAARLPLAQHEVGNLPLPALADRVRTAITRGDKPAEYLFAELVPARLKGEQPRPDSREGRAAAELRRMLGQIRDALRDTSLDPIRREADAVLKEAFDLKRPARKRDREQTVATTVDGRPKVSWKVAR